MEQMATLTMRSEQAARTAVLVLVLQLQKVEVAVRLPALSGPMTVLLLGVWVEPTGLVVLIDFQRAPLDEVALSEVVDEAPSLRLVDCVEIVVALKVVVHRGWYHD